MALPLLSAHIIAVFVQSVLFGAYLVSCWFCTIKLLRRRDSSNWRNKSEVNWLVLIIGILMFLNGTVNLAVGLARVIIAFVYSREGPMKFFASNGSGLDVTKNSTIHIQYLLGDFVLIYRCFYIYSRSKLVVILPSILWLGSIYVWIHETILQVGVKNTNLTSVGERPLGPLYFKIFLALTIAQNLLSTGLIVFRLWRVNANVSATDRTRFFGRSSSPVLRILVVVVESGMFITTIAFITFVLAMVHASAVYITVNAGVMIVSLSFNLIIIRSVHGGGQTSHKDLSTHGRGQISGIEVRMETFASHAVTGKNRSTDFEGLEGGDKAADAL